MFAAKFKLAYFLEAAMNKKPSSGSLLWILIGVSLLTSLALDNAIAMAVISGVALLALVFRSLIQRKRFDT